MKLVLDAVRPALVNRLYRAAFRAGHGRERSGMRQTVARPLFYLVEALRFPPGGRLEIDLSVRGRPTTLRLNPFNRQFAPLYFAKYAGGYEPTVGRSLDALLPDDGVFLDIGSNWGYFPLLVASRASFTGKVIAFEPVPSSYADLVDLVAQAGLEEWVETRQAAVGKEDGAVAMATPRHSGLARIDPSGEGTRVPLVRLDSLDLEKIDLVKIDVEGHELAVFEGAETALRRLGPALVFESGVGAREKAQPPLEYLESLGYRLHRPEIVGEGIRFHPFRAADRPSMQKYFNVVALPQTRNPNQP